MFTKWLRRQEAGFTLLELMVSLGVFSIFMAAAAGFMGQWMHSAAKASRRISDVNQTARLAMEYAGVNVSRMGAGQLFSPNRPSSSPGYALIPLDVTSTYGGNGALSILAGGTSDGGLTKPDQLTFVFSKHNRLARVVWDDRNAHQILLDFKLQDATRGAVPPGKPYPFFSGYFSSVEPSPLAPGNWEPAGEELWDNALLLIKTPDSLSCVAINEQGEKGECSQYEMVRVRGKPILFAAPGNSFMYLVNYTEEPQNPFNRWLQSLSLVSGYTRYYPDAEQGNLQRTYQLRKDAASIERYGRGNATLGCIPRATTNEPINGCFTAMLVEMQTLFITNPGDGILPATLKRPALATLTYTAPPTTLNQDAQILSEDVEDFQVEYYFKDDPASKINFSEDNPQAVGMRGRDDLLNGTLPAHACEGLWCAENVPIGNYLKGIRLSLRASAFVDYGSFYSDDTGAKNELVKIGNRDVYPPDDKDGKRFRRIVRQYFALRNMNTSYQPLEQNVQFIQ
ncbi:MAG: prepilin-type N-terminal cleavage/methylation domain-containing protein [Bdellovibrionota bacterium]